MSQTRYAIDNETGEKIAYRGSDEDGWVPLSKQDEGIYQVAEETKALDSMAISAGRKTDQLIRGAQSIYPWLLGESDQNQEQLNFAENAMDILEDQNPYSSLAGGAIAELGQMATPAGAIGNTLKVVGALGKPAARFAGDLFGSGATAALREPDSDQTRMGNAATDAAATVAGGVVGKAASGFVNGIGTKVAGAQDMIDKGVDMTLGMAGKSSGLLQQIQRTTSILPFFAKGYEQMSTFAKDNWHKVALKAAALPGLKITKSGAEGIAQLGSQFKQAYQRVWDMVDYNQLDMQSLLNTLDDSIKFMNSQDDRTFMQSLQKMIVGKVDELSPNSEGVSAITTAPWLRNVMFNDVDRILNAAKQEVAGKGKTTIERSIQDMIDMYRGNLDENVLKELSSVDQYFPNYLAVKKAAFAAKNNFGHFTPQQLLTSSGQIGGIDNWAQQMLPLQELAETGIATVGRKDAGMASGLLNMASKDLGSIPPRGMKFLLDPLIGASPTQKLVRKTGEILRNDNDKFLTGGVPELLRAPRIGAALNNDDKAPSQQDIDSYINTIIKDYRLREKKKEGAQKIEDLIKAL
jgi:hypothetical protein